MDSERKRDRVRSFVLGGVVGASAAAAAGWRRRRRPRPPGPEAGLAAFEGAPCFREIVEREGGRRDPAAERAPAGTR